MEMVAENGDIMTKIFTHLPVKSLYRFKSVSKHWLSLISDPNFSQKHYSFHQPSPDSSISSFFLQPLRIFDYLSPEFAPIDKPNSGVPDPSLSFLEEGFVLKNSCNGLLLCQREMGEDITYCVCNPTIMEYKLLPQLTKNNLICSSIVFDPSKSPHYKVVCVSSTKPKHVGIDIYSSQTGLWKASVEAFYEDRWLLNEKGVLWNGALHWTTPRKSFISFHVERESFWTTKMPPKSSVWDYQKTCRYFGKSNGHLYFIETDDSCKTKLPIEFDIWEMEHDYSQWCVRYHVNLDAMVKAYPEMLVLRAAYFHPDKKKYPVPGPLRVSFTVLHLLLQERGEEVLWIYIPGKIIKYQIRDGTFVDYYDLPRRTYYGLQFPEYLWRDVYKFSNTLSSIH